MAKKITKLRVPYQHEVARNVKILRIPRSDAGSRFKTNFKANFARSRARYTLFHFSCGRVYDEVDESPCRAEKGRVRDRGARLAIGESHRDCETSRGLIYSATRLSLARNAGNLHSVNVRIHIPPRKVTEISPNFGSPLVALTPLARVREQFLSSRVLRKVALAKSPRKTLRLG